eukprot:CAMPEP_0195119156 /NCGR_PEP_ID=MMETSP0448-20130528/118691_1 /TAXON_ID=66468 /ORGANISM="Heterocapsa triquestra, Strain CCMP 448" /LENGTH=375 /DNA_ID=CAMNT_0040156463 /DNA_START=86 /DNA_END=1213 /DNA_ORIENTATION=-
MRLLWALLLLAQAATGSGTAGTKLFCSVEQPTERGLQPAPAGSASLLSTRSRRGITLDSNDGMHACQAVCKKYSDVWHETNASMACAHKCRDLAAHSGDCKPIMDCQSVDIEFEDMDFNKNGQITLDEALLYGRLLCIPSKQITELYSAVDKSKDGKVDMTEWSAAGEDSQYEATVDKVADDVLQDVAQGNASSASDTPADLQASVPASLEAEAQRLIAEIAADHEVHAPKFVDIDKNEDGFIQDWELFSSFMREILLRHPDCSYELRQYITSRFWAAIDDIFPRLDTDGDLMICPQEYEAAVNGDMGDEMQEAQEQQETQAAAEADDPQPGMTGSGAGDEESTASFLEKGLLRSSGQGQQHHQPRRALKLQQLH